jgi:L-iditol 2-dehydrogenase
MRVAMYYNNNDIRVEEKPIPRIGPEEILVKIMASGICGSDVLEWYRIKKAPIVLGHEVSGEVIEAGEGVDRFKPGDRVFVNHHVPCNTCRYCLSGNHTVCETLHTTNFDPGGFSEYIRVPRINVERGTFILPRNVSYEEGTFVEPLACVIRGQRLAGLKPEKTVLIIGSGISGLLHILCARAGGTRNIIATDINRFKLSKALEFGARAVLDARENIPERVKELNEGRLADVIIVCTGAPKAFEQAIASVERSGTILCFATTEPDVELKVPINRFWRNSVTLMSSYANSPLDAYLALSMLSSRVIDVNPLITHRLKLEETGLGFKLMTTSQESLKVIIDPRL